MKRAMIVYRGNKNRVTIQTLKQHQVISVKFSVLFCPQEKQKPVKLELKGEKCNLCQQVFQCI